MRGTLGFYEISKVLSLEDEDGSEKTFVIQIESNAIFDNDSES